VYPERGADSLRLSVDDRNSEYISEREALRVTIQEAQKLSIIVNEVQREHIWTRTLRWLSVVVELMDDLHLAPLRNFSPPLSFR
jgi:hypothetical protein